MQISGVQSGGASQAVQSATSSSSTNSTSSSKKVSYDPMDLNGDGVVTPDEIQQYQQQQAQASGQYNQGGNVSLQAAASGTQVNMLA
nr:hypothetical protein [uncultured Holophaga sp.]